MRTYTLLRLPSGLLATRAALPGPSGVAGVRLVIDTGAVYTVVHPSFLERTGTTSKGEISVRTLERIVHLPAFTVERISVFGATRPIHGPGIHPSGVHSGNRRSLEHRHPLCPQSSA